jgi:chemotaxis protein methyltransferase CheR
MTDTEYKALAKLLQDRSAIVLDPGKDYLVESRLNPVARRHNLTLSEFLGRVGTPQGIGYADEIIEAMVTTETSFFRDGLPFDSLRKTVLPELIRSRQAERKLTIWCGAASSGQEPYTLAILLREYFPELLSWTITFHATDLSHTMLNRCRDGRYSQLEVNRGLPAPLLLKYFQQDGTTWQIRPEIRAMIDFRPLNLALPWPTMPPWDVVFLRNVMIYFDVPTKQAILKRLARVLKPDGYLVLGGAETTYGLDDSYRRVDTLKSGFFQRKPGS